MAQSSHLTCSPPLTPCLPRVAGVQSGRNEITLPRLPQPRAVGTARSGGSMRLGSDIGLAGRGSSARPRCSAPPPVRGTARLDAGRRAWSGSARRNAFRAARIGLAQHGPRVWYGSARCGVPWLGSQCGMAQRCIWRGAARRGTARRGMAWQSAARFDTVRDDAAPRRPRPGVGFVLSAFRCGVGWRGVVRRGTVARLGSGFQPSSRRGCRGEAQRSAALRPAATTTASPPSLDLPRHRCAPPCLVCYLCFVSCGSLCCCSVLLLIPPHVDRNPCTCTCV
jgi:hypothetical protein